MTYLIEQQILHQIDVSELTAGQQVAFTRWLHEQTPLLDGLKNALQRGQHLKAGLVNFRRREQYLVRIVD